MEEHEDDFIFKPATSPKLTDNINVKVNSNESVRTSQSPTIQSQNISNTPVQTNNIRFPFLDNLINEKKKEIDMELNKMSKIRFENFLEKEKLVVEVQKEEKDESVTSFNSEIKKYSKYSDLDKKEAEMFKNLKLKAQETWKDLKEEYKKSLEQLQTTQSARLSQELQLQESLQASGSVFNRDLFEKVVEKCGKGKGTAYGKEKMARFWEVLDKSYPKNSSNTEATSPNKVDDDKLLASLLGI